MQAVSVAAIDRSDALRGFLHLPDRVRPPDEGVRSTGGALAVFQTVN